MSPSLPGQRPLSPPGVNVFDLLYGSLGHYVTYHITGGRMAVTGTAHVPCLCANPSLLANVYLLRIERPSCDRAPPCRWAVTTSTMLAQRVDY